MADSGWIWSSVYNQYYCATYVNGELEYRWHDPAQSSQASTDYHSTPRSVTVPSGYYTEASQNEPEAEATEPVEYCPTEQYDSSRYSSHYAHDSGYDRTWATPEAITSNYGRQATNSGAGRSQYSTAEGHDLATQSFQQMSLGTNYDNHEPTSSYNTGSSQGDPIPEEEKVVVRPKRITGTNGERESLDKSYKQIKKASKFFTRGRVFMVLWMEPASSYAPSDTWITQTRLNENVYSAIRRFVVVKENDRHCLCVPITTYGGRGTTKHGIRVGDHAIIYTGNEIPDILAGEEGLTKDALQVIEDRSDNLLDPLSRVNFGKVYTVEHNVKVKNVGLVARGSMAKLKRYYEQIMLEE